MKRSLLMSILAASVLAATVCVAFVGCGRIVFGIANLDVDKSSIVSVAYDPARDLELDVHRPSQGRGGAPVVVFFYGGSWQSGRREDYRFVAQSLARQGVLVIVPDYRKFPQARFPAFVEDAAAAVAWTRQHAIEFGGDPKRIFLAGHSAGAHIAAMLGTDARYLHAVGMRPRDLAGVIGLAGPYDFLPITDPALKPIFAPEARWPESQPVNYVDGDEPPFLLLQGTSDTKVRPRNAPRLADRLRARGETVDLRMLDGAGHVDLLIGLVREDSPVRHAVLDYIEAPNSAAMRDCDQRISNCAPSITTEDTKPSRKQM
jgi:acetyl esterase/lipase